MKPWVIAAIISFTLAACARHVVLAPEEISKKQDPAWHVISEPEKARTKGKQR